MPDDVVFKLTTVYDGTSVAEGMSGTTSVIEGDTAAWKEAFNSTFLQIDESNTTLIASIEKLTAAIDTIPIASERAAAESGTAFSALSDRIVNTAEVAKLEAAGIGGAFSGLGALLGGGIAVGFLAHFLDETNKEVIALGNLSTQTGISISSLAGLQLTTRELGIDFQVVQQSTSRLEAAQARAVEGSRGQVEAFQRIGLSVKDIKDLSPEELFNTVSGAVQNTASSSDIAASSMTLLGRGGKALIPVFKEYGSSLDEVMKKLGEESGVTETAYAEALKYQKVMADLGDTLRKVAIESIPLLTTAIRYGVAGFDELAGTIDKVAIRMYQYEQDAEAISNATLTLTSPMQAIRDNAREADAAIAQLTKDTTDHVRSALGLASVTEVENQGTKAIEAYANSGKDLAHLSDVFAQVKGDWFAFTQAIASEGAKSDPFGISSVLKTIDQRENKPSGAGAPAPKDNRLEEWKLQLQQMEDASNASHIVIESQELAFWDKILQIQTTGMLDGVTVRKLTTAEELAASHAAATLDKEITKELKDDIVRSYEEQARAAGEGSQKQIEILQTLYDFAVQAYGGQFTPQAMRTYDQIVAASHKAAEQQIKDVTEVAKAAEKAAQQRLEEAQKQLETQHKEDTTQIESSGKQTVGALGGGKGIIGGGIQLEVAQQDTQQLLTLDESFAAASIANARAIEAAKVEELNKIRSETQAQYDVGALGEQAYNEKIKQLDTEQEAAVEAEKTKELDIARKTADQKFQIEQQYAKQVETIQQEIANRAASELDKMILQSRNFHEAITKLWVDIVQGIIKQIDKMATEFITRQLIMVAAKRSADTALDAAQGTADVGKTVVNNAANAAAAESYIGTAAAAAFAGQLEISDGLDVPGAVAAASAVESAGQVFVAQASAEGGWELPGSGGPFPMIGHPDEMMLPAPISTGLKRMITMQSLQENNSSTTNAAPAIGNLHYHAGDVHAMDGTGVSDVLSKHPAQLAKMVSGLVSRGHLDPRGFVR
jgi:hypothetical protein